MKSKHVSPLGTKNVCEAVYFIVVETFRHKANNVNLLVSLDVESRYQQSPKDPSSVDHAHPSIHPLSVTALSLLWGRTGFLLELIPAVSGAVASSSQGSQFGVQYLAHGHFDMQLSSGELGFEPATFHSLADLLYRLSYSRPDRAHM